MFSSSTKALFFILISISCFVDAKLTVRKPESFIKQFDAVNGIDYVVLTPQNKITYKRLFVGNLMLADPVDACSGVAPIKSGAEPISNPVLIANWGDCNYEQKVKNAEVAGAKMLLLVLKHNMPLNHGSIREITLESSIQVLAISQTDGAKLIKHLEEEKKKVKPGFEAVVEIKYTYEPQKQVNYVAGDTVNIDYWFAAGDESLKSYDFFDVFAELLKDFGKKVVFTPRYILWRNEVLEEKGFNEDDNRCLAGGRYCDPEAEDQGKLFGAHGVIEDLRQICFRNLVDKITPDTDWWRYTSSFGVNCVHKPLKELDDCRRSILANLGISSGTIDKVESCMTSSFRVQDVKSIEKARNSNSLLEKELELRDDIAVDSYPALYANGKKYKDSFRNTYAIQEFICSQFKAGSAPKLCNAFKELTFDRGSTFGDFAFYGLIVIVSVLVMAVMLYCVRRTVKRQVMGRMNDEISHIVTQYKQFKDKSTIADDEL